MHTIDIDTSYEIFIVYYIYRYIKICPIGASDQLINFEMYGR